MQVSSAPVALFFKTLLCGCWTVGCLCKFVGRLCWTVGLIIIFVSVFSLTDSAWQPRCRCRTLSLAEGWLRVVRPTQAPWCLRTVWVLGLQAPSAPKISGKIPKWFRQSFINAVVVKSITFDAFWSDHGGECFGEGSGRSVGRRRTRPDGLDANWF